MAAPTAEELAQLLGNQALAAEGEDRALAVIGIVTALARSYTRNNNNGFVDGVPADDLHAVILTAAARMITHAAQVPVSTAMGAMSVSYPQGGFVGWSLVELATLNRYRDTAM